MRTALLAFLILVAFSGCQAIAGITDRVERAPDAEVAARPCTSQTRCAANEMCLLGTCSRACRSDGECPTELRCLNTNEGAACVSSLQAECASDSSCPSGTACRGGECRSECVDANACSHDQQCAERVCVGTSSDHDRGLGPDSGPPLDAAAG